MITCRRCKFEVASTMKFSIQKNICPSCGAALFGNTQMAKIELLKEKILDQEFSKSLPKDIIFELALFVFSEMSVKVDKDAAAEVDVAESTEFEESGAGPKSQDRHTGKSGSLESDLDSIRDQVRQEAIGDEYGDEASDEYFAEEDVDADIDLKVARLKRVHKEASIKRPPAMIRRVSDRDY